MDMDTEYAYPVCHVQRFRPDTPSGVDPEACRLRIHSAAASGDVVELVRVGPGALAAVEAGQRGHGRLVQLEVEDREVLLHAAAVDRLGEDDVPALHVPAQGDLGGRPADGLSDLLDRRVVADLAARDRGPRLDLDLVLLVERPERV